MSGGEETLLQAQPDSSHTPHACCSLQRSLTGAAVRSTLGLWEKLVSSIGDVGLDNTMAEDAIRPFVVGRKNWLFAARQREQRPAPSSPV
ncbi:MAG: hypothetical protein CSA21_08115 [Deltaproteobacteria bacterium]|nr:MAG: hypothetical protein CSA21_08115 [Deltaproteobacteria bacterium]